MAQKKATPSFRMPPRRTPKPTPQATKPYIHNGKKVLRPDGTPVLVADPDHQQHDRCVKCGKPGTTCGDCGVVLCHDCNTNPYPAAEHQPKAHLVPMSKEELEPKGRLKEMQAQRQAVPRTSAQQGLTLEQAIMQLIAKMERFMANQPNQPQQPTQTPNPQPQPGTAQPAQTPNPAPTPQPKG